MAVTYTSALKQTRMEAVIAAIDAGTAGKLVIMTGASAVLATFTLADPCGAASGGVLTFDFDPDLSTTATGTGTAALAKIVTSADADVVTGLTVTATGGGGDIEIDNVSITSGQTVTATTGTITHG
jgi:hypothetical protein